jgi:hypothetical protein
MRICRWSRDFATSTSERAQSRLGGLVLYCPAVDPRALRPKAESFLCAVRNRQRRLGHELDDGSTGRGTVALSDRQDLRREDFLQDRIRVPGVAKQNRTNGELLPALHNCGVAPYAPYLSLQ